MAFADDYALIGNMYGGMTSSLWNVERRYSSTVKEGLDINILDNDTETDVDFMTQLYRNSHPQYFLGSWIIRPVIEVLLHYMGYPRVTAKDKTLADKLNEFYEASKGNIQQLFRELSLFGEEYAIVGYDSDLGLPTLKAKNKMFVVETRFEDFNNPDELTYVSIKEIVYQLKSKAGSDRLDNEKEEVTFLKEYWKEDNTDYKKAVEEGRKTDNIPRYKYYASLKKKSGTNNYKEVFAKRENIWGVIPVQQFNQNRLSTDANGYSDANGLIKLCGVYHQVFESMIDTNIYNGKPTILFTGLSNAEEFVRTTYGEINPSSGEIIGAGSYELFGSYYLEGSANAEYLQVGNNYIEGAKEILRLLFYIFIQLSGVPEWALGAHIDGSWASTKMQSTPLIQKINSKRLDINDAIVKMNAKIARIIEANEDIKFSTYLTQLEWSEPLPEDRDYILSAIDKVIPLEILTNEKILELLDIVANPSDEIKKKEKEKAKKQLKENIDADELTSRIQDKLALANKNKVDVNKEEKTEKPKAKENKPKKEKLEKGKAGEMSEEIDENIGDVLESLLGEDYLEELGLV